MDWTQMAQDIVPWQVSVNTVMEFQAHKKGVQHEAMRDYELIKRSN
jgi:hypothetical protein